MRRPVQLVLAAAVAATAAFATVAGAPAAAGPSAADTYERLLHQSGQAFFRQHGYLPVDGVEAFYRSKIAAARWAEAHGGGPVAVTTGRTPAVGASWDGQKDTNFTPPDANGAIGPNSFIETINQQIGIYDRTGAVIAQAQLQQLTGATVPTDPMILWDPTTQRFYYNVLDIPSARMFWGFSKDANPTQIPTSFCNYSSQFGYVPGNVPDYPKLGQSKDFLLIGVNFYPSLTTMHATQSDLLWIRKPQGSDPILVCPPGAQFGHGKFADLRMQDGSQAWTPVPAIEADTSRFGVAITMSDIECPDICGTGSQLTVHVVRPAPWNPAVPQLLSPHSITVSTFESPPDAPQQGSSNLLDTLDGRLTHAVAGFDPRVGAGTVWIGHTVLGGAGSEIRWYEINPAPLSTPSIVQSGTVADGSLYTFDAGVSNDRTCTVAACAHGDSMVLGFTTSSPNDLAAVQMVSKTGAGAQSSFVLVFQSTTPDVDGSCSPCRWGDYGGATPDPGVSLTAAHGEVWLSNQWTDGGPRSWNWEAMP